MEAPESLFADDDFLSQLDLFNSLNNEETWDGQVGGTSPTTSVASSASPLNSEAYYKKIYREFAVRKWQAKRQRRKFMKKVSSERVVKKVCLSERSSVSGRFVKTKPKFVSITDFH